MRAAGEERDRFVEENLPEAGHWPTLRGLLDLGYPPFLNCAEALLEPMGALRADERCALRTPTSTVSYGELRAESNRVANVLVSELGLRPGMRVLLRSPNNPALVVAWLAVLKAGGVVVNTMPMLRPRELTHVLDRARVDLALGDASTINDLVVAAATASHRPRHVVAWGTGDADDLHRRARRWPAQFRVVVTRGDAPALIAFTSGTTGPAKGTVHLHRDVLAICDTFARAILRAGPDDVFCGTPPLAFTYGLGGLLTFPLRVGASVILLEKPGVESLGAEIARQRATVLFSAPTMYRSLLDRGHATELVSLRTCVSAGEHLPAPLWHRWREQTGLAIVDGIGSTEMLHIFIASAGSDIRPGSTGRVVPGYRAEVVDEDLVPVPPGTVGRLVVQGPTGCRYLCDPERQRSYVRDGWNVTGDAFVKDRDGYFWYQARTDDMIISAGYNISPAEVESVLLEHPAVSECAVVAQPHELRGHVVKAFVVPRPTHPPGSSLAVALQDFVKKELAPYKYPRLIEFVERLPRTDSGKVQRHVLRAINDRGQPLGGLR